MDMVQDVTVMLESPSINLSIISINQGLDHEYIGYKLATHDVLLCMRSSGMNPTYNGRTHTYIGRTQERGKL